VLQQHMGPSHRVRPDKLFESVRDRFSWGVSGSKYRLRMAVFRSSQSQTKACFGDGNVNPD
jgi:hypothetical protein